MTKQNIRNVHTKMGIILFLSPEESVCERGTDDSVCEQGTEDSVWTGYWR
jgi:hypothetical protein